MKYSRKNSLVNVFDSMKCDFAMPYSFTSDATAPIQQGDMLLIEDTNDIQNGEIAALIMNNTVSVARIYRSNDGDMICISDSPRYTVNVYHKDSDLFPVIIGRVTGLQRAIR